MNVTDKGWNKVRMAMGHAVHGWLYDPNVMFIDYGWRERGGRLVADERCIRVHVINKFSPGLALETAIQSGKTRAPIPDMIAGIPVDRPVGEFQLHSGWWGGWWSPPAITNPRADRRDPMQGGISISNSQIRGYGTLGGLVIDRASGAKMILSNWHVLAGYWHAQAGWPIYQPGRGDGGTSTDTAAKLARHAMASNLDAAVAELTGSRQLVNDQLALSPVKGVGWAQLGMKVIKSGRRTNITRGRVTGVEGVIKISYNGVKRLIRNVITIEPRLGVEVRAGGDSGSLWLEEETMHVVGLHFAGSNHPERALAIDIQPVLDALNVDMAVSH